MSEIRPESSPSDEFVLQAGDALMAWWNQQGATLPADGERFRVWWLRTRRELENDWFPQRDAYQALQTWASEASEWWSDVGGVGKPPPVLLDEPSSGMSGLLGAYGAGVVTIVGVAIAAWLFSKR